MKPTFGACGALALLVCTCSQTPGDRGGGRDASASGGAPAPDGGTESGGVTGTGGVPSSGGAAGTGSTAGSGGGPGSGGSRPATGGAAMPPASGGAAGGASGSPSAGGSAGRGRGGAGGITASGGSRGSGGSPGSAGTPGSGGTPPAPLAFPQAQGFGKMVTGGREGVVYHVTTLNDAGAGSFRDAVSHSNRFVIFDVGGYVQLVTAGIREIDEHGIVGEDAVTRAVDCIVFGTGFVVDPENRAGLRQAVVRMLRDRTGTAAMGRFNQVLACTLGFVLSSISTSTRNVCLRCRSAFVLRDSAICRVTHSDANRSAHLFPPVYLFSDMW